MTTESEIAKVKALIDKCRFDGQEKSVLETYLQSLGGSQITNKEQKNQTPLFITPDNFREKLREKDIFNGEIKSNGGKNGSRT